MSNKKRSSLIALSIFLFCFGNCIPYNKSDLHQIQFEEYLRFFVAKELFPLSFVGKTFFRKLILKQNPHLNFPLRVKMALEI